MVNIEVKEFKINIEEEEYTFRLDFNALLRFTKKHDNALEIFNDFLQNKDIYGCIIKILSCACVEREFEEDELASKIPFNFKSMKLFDDITMALVEGTVAESEDNEKN